MEVPVELKQRYLSRRIQELAVLKEALLKDDYSHALRIGHQVKGNAVTFDFPLMASMGSELEHAARKQDKEKLFIIVQKMESAITAAQSFFVGRKASVVPELFPRS